jgi:hypothetical protein
LFELKGLIIDAPHIDHILAGRKRWEMRAAPTRQRGPIALIRRDSGAVVGVADLIDSLGPLTENELLATGALHLIPSQRLRSMAVVKYRYAWVLDNARPLSTPIAYRHTPGAVTWVNLHAEIVNALETGWVA